MKSIIIAIGVCITISAACQNQIQSKDKQQQQQQQQQQQENAPHMTKYNSLTAQEERVLIHKATDMPFTGEYYRKKDDGIYVCRRCNNPLYTSKDKFESDCGWPSFDDEIKGAVKRITDADGRRVEIICANCGGHLGHVFTGEGFTDKDTRHCVNTSSIKFVPEKEIKNLPPVISQK